MIVTGWGYNAFVFYEILVAFLYFILQDTQAHSLHLREVVVSVVLYRHHLLSGLLASDNLRKTKV